MRFLGPESVQVRLLWLTLSLAVLALLLLALRGLHRSDAALAICYVAVAGLLISPVSWSHHWVWLVPLATASLCTARRFPLVLVAVSLTWLVMLGDPWFLTFGATLPQDPDPVNLVWAHGYVSGGLLILVVAAGYGIREITAARKREQAPTPEGEGLSA